MWDGKEPKVQKAPGNTFQFYLGDGSFNFLSSFPAVPHISQLLSKEAC